MEKIRYFCECGFDQETTAWMTATGLELKLTPGERSGPWHPAGCVSWAAIQGCRKLPAKLNVACEKAMPLAFQKHAVLGVMRG
jgi:hypothetical protein